MKVLVAEKIGDSGIELLRSQGFDVDFGTDWTRTSSSSASASTRAS